MALLFAAPGIATASSRPVERQAEDALFSCCRLSKASLPFKGEKQGSEFGRISKPPTALVSRLHLAPFYQKYLDMDGLPILGSAHVTDAALREAAYLASHMLHGRKDILAALIRHQTRIIVMAYTEMTTQIPEHSDLTPADYWDRRARGLGATPERPAVSCGEENLLNFPGDPYRGENILIHEFAHTIHEMGLRAISPDFDTKLQATYRAALAKGLWKGFYAATNAAEYWAEGVQSWFNANHNAGPNKRIIGTREELRAYDPDLANLIAPVFSDSVWRYVPPVRRGSLAHLQGYDPTHAPRFAWPAEWQVGTKDDK